MLNDFKEQKNNCFSKFLAQMLMYLQVGGIIRALKHDQETTLNILCFEMIVTWI